MRVEAISPVLVAAALLSSTAHADCAQALAAFEKAQREPRIAVHMVADKNEKPSGDPMQVRIGDSVYINGVFNGLQPGFFKDSSTIFPHTTDFKSTAKVTVVCKAMGDDQYRGKPATRVHVQRSDRDKGNTVWFDRASGLPVYQEDDAKTIGLAFEYGNAVKDPVVRR
jgi:hypothetical protein